MSDREERKKQVIEKIIESFKEKKSINEDELLNILDSLSLDAS